ncbi:hypothetical protein CVT25_010824 [Psilocybe cyanescens]|uniref:Uncharacterized protein n=1 Tax=Psilocybe cyanescens TaxID=93625 RepID=A0A409WF93_PSICY|nr:hypothetical protein CVT25_010824 [Psilocybe cyanescens]
MECCDGANRPSAHWTDTVATRRIFAQRTSYLGYTPEQAVRTLSELSGPRHTSGRHVRQAPSTCNAREDNPNHPSLPAALKDEVGAMATALTSSTSDTLSHVPTDLSHSTIPSSTSHPTRKTHSAISTIVRLLSPSEAGRKSSIRTLATFYDEASTHSALHLLDQGQFTTILSLCGTLASKALITNYHSTLAARFQPTLSKTQLWSFIARVGADKAKSGYILTLEDHYWIMQAYLAQARVMGNTNSQSDFDLLHRQYEQLQSMSDAPDVHLPYLDFLISTSNIADAVRCLCRILQRATYPDPRLAELLWDIILLHGSDLSIDSKELICTTAFHRTNMVPIHRKQSSFGVLTIPSLTSDVVRQGIIRIPHMSAAFAAALFSCYTPHYPGQFLVRWANQQARQAFLPQIAIEIRWCNIILLAAAIYPKNLPVSYRSSTTASPDSGNSLWRTTLILESMNRTLASTGADFGSLCGKVQDIARPLWLTFLSAEKANQPVDITRAYISTFLQIAAKSYDEQLKGECYRLSQELGLWNFRQTDHWATKAQSVDTIAAYVRAHISCEGRDWKGCFSTISALLPGLAWQEDVANILIRRYSQENVETAYDLYVHCLEVGISISHQTVDKLFMGLVKYQRWDIITMFLNHSSTTQDQLQFLFGESLRLFQIERFRYVDPTFVKLLTQTASKLYERDPPPQSLKYSIRYFLSIMIWTHYVRDMVKLVELLHRSVPSFFTPRLLHTLALHLIRRRELLEAFKLFRIFERAQGKPASPSLERIRHKLMFKFSKVGAHNVARQVMRGKTRIVSLTRREALAHYGLSMLQSPLRYYRCVQRVGFRASGDGPTVREAISLLVKAKRTFSARKLYARCRSTLDVKTRTAIGNIIIHGPIQGSGFRNARLVRRVVKIKDLLINEYGFVPDRTTLNIILKSILRWETTLDAPKVRRLFDNMAHEGYPIPEQFRRTHGVPFSSPRGSFKALPLSSLAPGFSFSKHIRPMYKMFIKAFYVRNDVSAAKTVVGILKEVEILEMRELEKRSKARREGVIKKRLKVLKKATETDKKGVKGT